MTRGMPVFVAEMGRGGCLLGKWKRLLSKKFRGILFVLLLCFCLFCFMGGPNLVDGLTSGFSTVSDARFGVTGLFYAGFLLTGFMGLFSMYRFRMVKQRCLLGAVMALFSFFGVEVLFFAAKGGL